MFNFLKNETVPNEVKIDTLESVFLEIKNDFDAFKKVTEFNTADSNKDRQYYGKS